MFAAKKTQRNINPSSSSDAIDRRGVSSPTSSPCLWQGHMVYLRQMPCCYCGRTRKLCQQLLLLHEIRHENLCPFIGFVDDDVIACPLDNSVFLAWENCVHGSLSDILVLESLQMDWDFKLALISDLVKVTVPDTVLLHYTSNW